jgi:hypothetical protein
LLVFHGDASRIATKKGIKHVRDAVLMPLQESLSLITSDWNGKTFSGVVNDRERLRKGLTKMKDAEKGIISNIKVLARLEYNPRGYTLVTRMALTRIKAAIKGLEWFLK